MEISKCFGYHKGWIKEGRNICKVPDIILILLLYSLDPISWEKKCANSWIKTAFLPRFNLLWSMNIIWKGAWMLETTWWYKGNNSWLYFSSAYYYRLTGSRSHWIQVLSVTHYLVLQNNLKNSVSGFEPGTTPTWGPLTQKDYISRLTILHLQKYTLHGRQ